MKIAITANKMRRIRAAQAHNTYAAHEMVEHDNVSVCCLARDLRVAGVRLSDLEEEL